MAAWAAVVRDELRDSAKLLAGEKYYPRVKVVAAGRSFLDLQAMQQRGIPVNIRNYPADRFTNGSETQIIGQIAQGRDILNVVLTPGVQPLSLLAGEWGVFKCSDAEEAVWGVGRSPEPDAICAVNGDYLLGQ